MAIVTGSSTGNLAASTLLGSDLARSVIFFVTPASWSTLAYSPFGYSGQLEQGVLHYTGQPIEMPNGLYILGNGYRMYSPTLFIFSTPDRLSPFEQGGLSAYAYTRKDPINSSDVSGSWGVKLFTRLIFKRPSIARSPAVASKLSYRTAPNGTRSTWDIRKHAAAMAERPAYTLQPVPRQFTQPIPPLPSTGLRPGKLRNPAAIDDLPISRPKHIYHLPKGSVQISRIFYTKPTPRSATSARFRTIQQRMHGLPTLWE